ncbi:MAG: reverse transcriptase/maturase family protein [Candidatus Thorarchaeota archaeon]
MKTYKNLYPKLCSYKNLELAFRKASKGKNKKDYVIEFKKEINKNLLLLKEELELEKYKPSKLTKFTIKDPKTRLIRKSIFKDRIVHHAVVNILDPIYEPRFIADNYANRLNKGTISALQRFDKFKRKASKNGKLVSYAITNNMVKGYVFKADIRKFFDSINQAKMIEILKRKIKDKKFIWLVIKILKNFDDKRRGMPLGNMTSQFFANVYLNDLDQFVKRKLRMKYYIRYVDDFLILHKSKETLEDCKDKIEKYLKNLKLELHPDKSKIYPLYKGVDFLGFKIFYFYRRARRRNVNYFKSRLINLKIIYKNGEITKEKFMASVDGWFAYIVWGDTYKLRKNLSQDIENFLKNTIPNEKFIFKKEFQKKLC